MIVVNPETGERVIVATGQLFADEERALWLLPTEAYRCFYLILREVCNMSIAEAVICALTPECRNQAIERIREKQRDDET